MIVPGRVCAAVKRAAAAGDRRRWLNGVLVEETGAAVSTNGAGLLCATPGGREAEAGRAGWFPVEALAPKSGFKPAGGGIEARPANGADKAAWRPAGAGDWREVRDDEIERFPKWRRLVDVVDDPRLDWRPIRVPEAVARLGDRMRGVRGENMWAPRVRVGDDLLSEGRSFSAKLLLGLFRAFDGRGTNHFAIHERDMLFSGSALRTLCLRGRPDKAPGWELAGLAMGLRA